MLNIVSATIFDTLVLSLTAARIAHSVVLTRERDFSNSISAIFLRDGALTLLHKLGLNVFLCVGALYYLYVHKNRVKLRN